MARLSILGTGYVGLVTGLCFSELGHRVTCIDIDPRRISLLRRGKSPIYEPSVDRLLKKHLGKRFQATTDYDGVRGTEATFLAIGTPSARDGSIDLTWMRQAVASLARVAPRDHRVVMKSTVVPGTTGSLVAPHFPRAAVNPEFLKEGSAVADFMHPDRIVVGSRRASDGKFVESLYRSIRAPRVHTDLSTAEMIKYASNAFLALKISYANELGNLCKTLGIDTYQVMDGAGLDRRIGRAFLNAGAGFGGSCFPKDVRALARQARRRGVPLRLLETTLRINEAQPRRALDLLRGHLGPLRGKRVAVLGLAFKPHTDDIRESRAIPVLRGLLRAGARVTAHDPQANENMKRLLPRVRYADSIPEALRGAHGCIVMTEWPQFARLPTGLMARPVVVDGRRIVAPGKGMIYEGIAW
ncbi:MAG: UDP-glucose/GDP-mannose dehydrogenase family protein [Euryarchaeota archaeon]|nr:UDP-glucose/GDP-mannose dehydrogenase family protein [Euryarchaeota archaeon]